jgi:RHS repeat-associated protein
VNLGSSDSDTFTYDPNTDRMTQYEFTANSQSIVGNLTWNAIGTLGSLAITDPFNSTDTQTCSYIHDDLKRLSSYNCGPIWSQTFSYDVFGNINKSGNSSFGAIYSSATNHMTLIGSSTPTYDSNGNVTNDFLHTYAWDANGRAVTADGVGLTYDGLGRMVEQSRSGSYTEIVYDPSGSKLALMTGSTLQKGFVPLTGGSVAVYNSSGLAYYRHSDWLKSSRFSSTPSRTMYADGAYAPFGESYAASGSSDLSFAGMNQDTVPNLYDFPAREYGIQGRWPSPDPSGLSSVHLKDPQTLNRYAYVRNSPASVVDPSGLANAPAGGTGVTITLYIPTATVPGGNSLLYGLGDDRGTDPNGGSYREQYQITYDPTQTMPDGNKFVSVTPSTDISQAVLAGATLSNMGQINDLPGAGPMFQAQANDDGSVTLQINTSATNGFADYPGGPPDPIDMSITVTMYPDGTGLVNGGTYSGYPSLEAYSYNNGFATLLENLAAGDFSQLGTNNTPIPPSNTIPANEIDSPIDYGSGGGGGGGGDDGGDYVTPEEGGTESEDASLLDPESSRGDCLADAVRCLVADLKD